MTDTPAANDATPARAHLDKVLAAIHARTDGDDIFATACALINMAATHKDETAGKLALTLAGSEVAANGFQHAREGLVVVESSKQIERVNSDLRLLGNDD